MYDLLNADVLRDELHAGPFGQYIHHLPECDSTNRAARDLAEEGAPEGTLVVADFQSAGRGRLGRGWTAPRGTSLLFSLVLLPAIPASRAAQIGMAAGLGAAEGIRRAAGVEARLKWPNDILVDGRKLGGMLSEALIEGDAIPFVVLGIGINVNFDPATIAGIPPEATSLQLCARRELSRVLLLRDILAALEPRYRAVCAGKSQREDWERALDTLGRPVRVTVPEGQWEGVAEAVDEDGALILRLPDGAHRRVTAGDVAAVRNI